MIVLLVSNTTPSCVSYLVYDLYLFMLASDVSVQHNANIPCVLYIGKSPPGMLYILFVFVGCGFFVFVSVLEDTIPTCVSELLEVVPKSAGP